MRTSRWIIGALMGLTLVSLLLVGGAKPAETAFPGTNGKIAFDSTRDGNW